MSLILREENLVSGIRLPECIWRRNCCPRDTTGRDTTVLYYPWTSSSWVPCLSGLDSRPLCLVLINYRLVFLIAKRFKMQQRTCQCNTVQGVVSSRECEASTNNPKYVCLESLELEKQFFKVDILYL